MVGCCRDNIGESPNEQVQQTIVTCTVRSQLCSLEPGRQRVSVSSLLVLMEASPRSSMWIPAMSHHLSLFSLCPTCPSNFLKTKQSTDTLPLTLLSLSHPVSLLPFPTKQQLHLLHNLFISMIPTKPPPSKMTLPSSFLPVARAFCHFHFLSWLCYFNNVEQSLGTSFCHISMRLFLRER